MRSLQEDTTAKFIQASTARYGYWRKNAYHALDSFIALNTAAKCTQVITGLALILPSHQPIINMRRAQQDP
jgi:hypothetical protein